MAQEGSEPAGNGPSADLGHDHDARLEGVIGSSTPRPADIHHHREQGHGRHRAGELLGDAETIEEGQRSPASSRKDEAQERHGLHHSQDEQAPPSTEPGDGDSAGKRTEEA